MGGRVGAADRRRAVFTSLYEAHWRQVRRHVEAQVPEDEEVDEVVADVFRIAWEKLRVSRPMGLPWLIRTADNRLRDRARRNRNRDIAFHALAVTAAHETTGGDPSDRLVVAEALRVLSPYERRVVLLTYWDELSAGEVAEVLGRSPGSVWTTLSRARGKLRSFLEDESGDQRGD